jgi:hypothetical protein
VNPKDIFNLNMEKSRTVLKKAWAEVSEKTYVEKLFYPF